MRRTSRPVRSSRSPLLALVAAGSVAVATDTSRHRRRRRATSEAPTGSAPALSGDITVFAAASLTESFTEVGEAFTAANPDATATFSFDASSALVQQIIEGAPADVFASADTANMDKLTDAGLNGTEPVDLRHQPADDHRRPRQPAGDHRCRRPGQPRPQGRVCAPEVPCGNYANQIFDRRRRRR